MNFQVNKRIKPFYLVIIFFVMLGLSFASVPLYELFCKATGFGGNTKVSKQIPNVIVNHVILTRFDTNVAKGLFWDFKTEKTKENIKPGQVSTVKFKVKNLGNETSTAVATFNVMPDSAGQYFNKISCFCFEQQTLKPKETKEFEMAYFIDPKIVDDLSAKEIKDITLSYTFFDVANFKKDKN
jgi:cytochrome c oxidase assembly protein subunit 11